MVLNGSGGYPCPWFCGNSYTCQAVQYVLVCVCFSCFKCDNMQNSRTNFPYILNTGVPRVKMVRHDLGMTLLSLGTGW